MCGAQGAEMFLDGAQQAPAHTPALRRGVDGQNVNMTKTSAASSAPHA